MKNLFKVSAAIFSFALLSCGGGMDHINGEVLNHWYHEDGEMSEDYYLIQKEDGSKTLEAFMNEDGAYFSSLERAITEETETEKGTLITDSDEYPVQYYINKNGDLNEWIEDELTDTYKKVD